MTRWIGSDSRTGNYENRERHEKKGGQPAQSTLDLPRAGSGCKTTAIKTNPTRDRSRVPRNSRAAQHPAADPDLLQSRDGLYGFGLWIGFGERRKGVHDRKQRGTEGIHENPLFRLFLCVLPWPSVVIGQPASRQGHVDRQDASELSGPLDGRGVLGERKFLNRTAGTASYGRNGFHGFEPMTVGSDPYNPGSIRSKMGLEWIGQPNSLSHAKDAKTAKTHRNGQALLANLALFA